MLTRTLFGRLLAAALIAGTACAAQAQQADYPNRAIRLIVPFPPGGNMDASGRIVAAGLTARLGQSVIVENRAGAAGMLGSEVAARSAPDGYTLLLTSTGGLAPARALNPDLKLDPERDLVSAGPVARAPLMLIVNPALPIRTVAEFIDYAKRHPGKLTFGTSGAGTVAHLTGELFQHLSGTRLVHVPYKGSSHAITDLMGGQIDATFDQPASTLSQIRAGKLRALAVTTAARSSVVPQLPTLAESGMAGFESSTTVGLMLPAGVPPAIIARINAAMADVLALPETRQQFAELGSDVVIGPGEDFDRVVRAEVAKWTRVVKESGIERP